MKKHHRPLGSNPPKPPPSPSPAGRDGESLHPSWECPGPLGSWRLSLLWLEVRISPKRTCRGSAPNTKLPRPGCSTTSPCPPAAESSPAQFCLSDGASQMLEGLQTENWKAKLVIRGRREQRAGREAPRRPPPPRLAASELHVPACGWFQEMLLTFLPRAHPGWDPGGIEPCVKQSNCPQIRVSMGTRWTWFWQFPLELTVPETRSAWSPGGGVHVPPRIGGGWQRGCLLAGGLFSCQACRNLAFLNRRGNTNQPHKQNLYKNIRLEFTLQFTFSIRGRTIFFSFKSFLSFPTILNGWNWERHQ